MVTRFILASLLFAVLLPVPGAAQDATAPHPSADERTLYAHSNVEGVAWMNTLVEDATGPETSSAFGANPTIPAYGESPAGPYMSEDFSFAFPLAPGLTSGLMLDPAGSVEVTTYLGGGAYTLGMVDVSTRLMAGETVIAEGASVSHRMTPKPPTTVGCQVYDTAAWSMEVLEPTIPAGAELVWIIEGSGSWNNIFVSTSECRGRSNIVLPIAGFVVEAPPVMTVWQNLTEGLVALDITQASSDTYMYNWTTNLTGARISYDVVAQEGNLSISVTDADGRDLLVHPQATGSNQTDAAGAAPGTWLITVHLDGFRGSLDLTLDSLAEAAPEGSGAPSQGNQPSAPGAGNSTAPEASGDTGAETQEVDGEDGKQAPGPAFVVVLVALGLAAVRRR